MDVAIMKYLPFEKGVALRLNKLESLQPRMLCTKFDWNHPFGCGQDEYVKKNSDKRKDKQTTYNRQSEKLVSWVFTSGGLKHAASFQASSHIKGDMHIHSFWKD